MIEHHKECLFFLIEMNDSDISRYNNNVGDDLSIEGFFFSTNWTRQHVPPIFRFAFLQMKMNGMVDNQKIFKTKAEFKSRIAKRSAIDKKKCLLMGKKPKEAKPAEAAKPAAAPPAAKPAAAPPAAKPAEKPAAGAKGKKK